MECFNVLLCFTESINKRKQLCNSFQRLRLVGHRVSASFPGETHFTHASRKVTALSNFQNDSYTDIMLTLEKKILFTIKLFNNEPKANRHIFIISVNVP